MKILRAIIIGVFVSILAIAIPVSLALAASEEIPLDPDEGEIGDYIDVDGENFDESGEDYEDYVFANIYLTHEEAEPSDDIDDDIENYKVVALSFSPHLPSIKTRTSSTLISSHFIPRLSVINIVEDKKRIPAIKRTLSFSSF